MKLDGSDPRICKNSQTFTMRGGRTCESMPAKFCNRIWKARRIQFHCPVRCNTCDFANRGLDSPNFKVTRKANSGPRRVGCDQVGQYLSCDRKQKPVQKFVSGVERKRAFVAYWCQETSSLDSLDLVKASQESLALANAWSNARSNAWSNARSNARSNA